MTPLLVCEPHGKIVGANDAAKRLLGECVGRDCWDVVGALDEERRLVCGPGCTSNLCDLADAQADRTVKVRGEAMRLICSAVGDLVVVQLKSRLSRSRPSAPLSPREREVLELLSQGHRAPAIAQRLGIGVATVRTHLAKARKKFGAHSQAELVARALQSPRAG